jgi:hypothetical protein
MAYHKADVARSNGINPWWLGVFNGVSAFNNSGMSLLDANMVIPSLMMIMDKDINASLDPVPNLSIYAHYHGHVDIGW